LGPASEGGSVIGSVVVFGRWFSPCVWSLQYLSNRDTVLFGDRAGDGCLLGGVGLVRWLGDNVVDFAFVNYTTLGSWDGASSSPLEVEGSNVFSLLFEGLAWPF